MSEKVPEEDRAELERRKAVSIGQLLFRAARLWNEEAIRRVRRGAFPGARLAHTQLLPHVDLDGTRLTDLSARLGVTKQATLELVNELERVGILERIPDPSDGRAKLIRFSRRGRRALLEGLDVLSALEGELRGELGDRKMDDLGALLRELLEAIEWRFGESYG